MRRLLGLIALLMTVVVLTGCHVKVPGVRQAANPCTLMGKSRLAHLAHARGSVIQKPLFFSQAQTCEFKARRGVPTLILGTFDARGLSFDDEVTRMAERYHADSVRTVTLRGADQASTMRATFGGVRMPVLMASHDGFISMVIVVTRGMVHAAGLERTTMVELVHASR